MGNKVSFGKVVDGEGVGPKQRRRKSQDRHPLSVVLPNGLNANAIPFKDPMPVPQPFSDGFDGLSGMEFNGFDAPGECGLDGNAETVSTSVAEGNGGSARRDDGVSLYLKEMGGHARVSPAKERQIAMLVESHGRDAMRALWRLPATALQLGLSLQDSRPDGLFERWMPPTGLGGDVDRHNVYSIAESKEEDGGLGDGQALIRQRMAEFMSARQKGAGDDELAEMFSSFRPTSRFFRTLENAQTDGGDKCWKDAFRSAKSRMESARNEMVMANLRLVVSICTKLHRSHGCERRGIALPDLIQDGNMGLMKAVDKFNWRKGYRFGTYATWWIRESVIHGMASQAVTVTVPVYAYEANQKINQFIKEVEGKTGTPPTVAGISGFTGVSQKTLRHMRDAIKGCVSLDCPVGTGDGATMGESIQDVSSLSPFDAVALSDTRDLTIDALSKLDERDRSVLCMRHGIGGKHEMTLQEIGAFMGISCEWVRRIEKSAKSRMKVLLGVSGFSSDA